MQTVTYFRKKLEKKFGSAIFAQRLAQSRQAAYNGKHYTPPSYKVRDEVYLSKKLFTDSSSSVRPLQKVSVHIVGPVCINEVINKNAVRAELTDDMSMHPFIHVEHTMRAHYRLADITTPHEALPQPFID